MLATLGFVTSLVIRLNAGVDARGTAIAISAAAWLVMIVSSYFGGEMVFGFGTEVNRQAWTDISTDWETVDVRAADLEDRKPVLAQTAGGIALFVTKLDGELYVMANTCTHAGGPLNEGTFVGEKGCEIQCPWHASRFCVKDGHVHGGPATFDEPVWSVLSTASGKLEVRSKP